MTPTAFAAEAPDLTAAMPSQVGTLFVKHSPQQRAGVLEGCSLEFATVFEDWKYRNGQIGRADGSFTLYITNKDAAGAALKLGVADITPGRQSTTEAPAFAYLQTSDHSTAKTPSSAIDAESKGYRLWALGLDGDLAGLVRDIADGMVPTLGFSRQQGGSDILAPIDLAVEETTLGSDGKFQRRRGDRTLNAFRACVAKLISNLNDGGDER